MRDADPIGPIARAGFPTSVLRHFERLEHFPQGLLCVGDALCSLNPIWGQGMSVAALQVEALSRVLSALAAEGAALTGIASWFFAEAARIAVTPWMLAVAPDLAYATTRNAPGAEPHAARGFSRALGRLAQQDAEIRALLNDVHHLVKPREALLAPELLVRVQPLISSQNLAASSPTRGWE
jgi:2-polyprenyl-6-methoxyphenol hydroxylase-like FAD-dependent oxidoreductase